MPSFQGTYALSDVQPRVVATHTRCYSGARDGCFVVTNVYFFAAQCSLMLLMLHKLNSAVPNVMLLVLHKLDSAVPSVM